MKQLAEFVNSDLNFLFTDIDDTLTDSGRLSAEAFSGLWKLSQNGINVVPVTGRPAGWCEMIARQWPVAGVVGENGAFYFRYKNRELKRHFYSDAATRHDNQKKLDRIRAEILGIIPGAAVASDQFSRMTDLAIDYCEDVDPLPLPAVEKIVEVFKKYGAQAKVSSIHVNGWFGAYDKLTMCRTFCEQEFGFDLVLRNRRAAFIGDSPNDEPMFEFFENSVAVANFTRFAEQVKYKPQYITSSPGGRGFAEFVSHILAHKNNTRT